MPSLLPNAKQQFVDGNGAPLASGSVYFYVPGTTTAKNTFQDADGTILNTNPVQLDSSGQAVIYGDGAYRQIVNDVDGNTIWDALTEDLGAVGSLTVNGDANIGGNAAVGNGLLVGNNLNVGGNISGAVGIAVAQNGSIGDSLTVTNNLNVGGNISGAVGFAVAHNGSIGDSLTVTNNLNVGGNISGAVGIAVAGNAAVTGGLNVGGNISSSNSISVAGDVTVGDAITCASHATFGTGGTVSQIIIEPGFGSSVTVNQVAGGGPTTLFTANVANLSSNHMLFQYNGGAAIGSINSSTGSSINYNTTSDYRLKNISGPFTGSGAIIDAVPVHLGAFKSAPFIMSAMFLAHELQTHMPAAVSGTMDAVDDKGNVVPQQVDHSSLVPLLWAEIQSLRARLTALGG